MTDTTRDLIQRMADALAEWQLGGAPPEDTADVDLINEARTLLSQPEPEGPTDDELDYLWTEIDGGPDCCAWRPYARAVLARWGRPITPTETP